MSCFSKTGEKMNKPVHGGVSPAELRALRLTQDTVIDFSVSINPLGHPPMVRDALSKMDISAYPDTESLEFRKAVSQVTGVPPEQIVAGNGSTELIHLLAHIYLRAGDTAVILAPTFSEYEVAAKRAGAELVLIQAEENNGFVWDLSAVCREIQRREPNLVFLCNPNNPTGVYLGREAVEAIIRAAGKGLLVLDEAYISFVQEAWNASEFLNQENMVILHSMTKDYALTGLRLGYALCSRDIATTLFASQPSWSVNAAAQAAGVAALSDRTHLLQGIGCVEAGKSYLRRELQALGYEILPTVANFLLVKVGNAAVLRRRLLTRGICVRDCTSFCLPEYIRIGVRTLPECQRLIEALKEVRAEASHES
jgi:histidinol-phosphate aminotransferase